MEMLGFTTSAPSVCEWELSGSRRRADASCVVFPHEYLDFIQISDPRWDQHLASSSIYGRGFAPTGVVVSGIDLEQAYARIAGQDPRQLAPYSITRRVETDPPFEIAYRFLALDLPLGLIESSSPQALRRPPWLSHPNTALGIGAVDLRVPSIREALAGLAEEPFLLDADSSAGAAAVIAVGETRIRLHEAPTVGVLGRVSQLLDGIERPSLLGVEFRIVSLEAASRALEANGVRFTQADAALEVDPEQGFGTAILLREDAAQAN